VGAGEVLGGPSQLSRRGFLTRSLVLTAGAGIAGLGGTLLEPMIVAAQGPWGSTLGPSRRLPLFDVTAAPYHARGDGFADDGPAIQAAIDDAAAVGGGIVFLPAGTYLLKSLNEQTGVRYYLLNYYSGVALVGSGRETTILQAGPGMPNETRIISANSADGTGRVTGALFKNFTVDGAADQQPDAQSMVGISNVWTDRISLLGVRVSRVKGTGAAEGVCFDSYYSTNHAYRDCEAQQIPTMATGSGFGATQSSLIAYFDCRASGSGRWMGFSAFQSRSIQYQGCHGFLNAQRGFNSESSSDISYRNCQAGGDQQGNRGDGVYVYQSQNVELFSCSSRGNMSGLVNTGSSVRIVGGEFVQNSRAGIAFGTEADWQNSALQAAPIMVPNGLGPIVVAGRPRPNLALTGA